MYMLYYYVYIHMHKYTHYLPVSMACKHTIVDTLAATARRLASAEVTHQVQHLRCRQHGVKDRPLGRASQDLGDGEKWDGFSIV